MRSRAESTRSSTVSTCLSRSKRAQLLSSHLLPNEDSAQIVELFDIAENGDSRFTVPLEIPLFEHYPHRIVLNEYEPFTTYTFEIVFRNRDKVPRRLKVIPPNSSCFSISSPIIKAFVNPPQFRVYKLSKKNPNKRKPPQNEAVRVSKVATGMCAVYEVTFAPKQVFEQDFQLTVETERERFLVPIAVQSQSTQIELSPKLDFKRIAVNSSSERCLLLRNTGRDTEFEVVCSAPFLRCQPDHGFLAQGQTQTLRVRVDPPETGLFTELLTLEHWKGQSECVIQGCAFEADLVVSHPTVTVPASFIHLPKQATFQIRNNSDVIMETHTEIKLSGSNQPTAEDQSIWRVFPDQSKLFPGGEVEMTVVFTPEEHRHYSDELRIFSTGRVSPVNIRLQSQGIGPRLAFSYDVLDVKDVFFGAVHDLTLSITNLGEIPADFSVIQDEYLESEHSVSVSVSPLSGIVPVEGEVSLSVKLRVTAAGLFHFPLEFAIQGLLKPLKVRFKGNVVIPKIRPLFKSAVDFAQVSVGFPTDCSVVLFNESTVPVIIQVCMVNERGSGEECCPQFTFKKGQIDAAENREIKRRIDQLIMGTPRVEWSGASTQRSDSLSNRSFEPLMNPNFSHTEGSTLTCCIPPMSAVKAVISLLSWSIRHYRNHRLRVDILNVQSGVLFLPVIAESIVPPLEFADPKPVEMGECYLQFGKETTLTIQNPTDLPLQYALVSPELPAEQEEPALLRGLSNPLLDESFCEKGSEESAEQALPDQQGIIDGYQAGVLRVEPECRIIEPNSQLQVKLTVFAESLGLNTMSFYVMSVGSQMMPLQQSVHFIGLGPAVELQTELTKVTKDRKTVKSLDFGDTPCLEYQCRMLKLFNPTPIPAPLRISLAQTDQCFTLDWPDSKAVGLREHSSALQCGAIVPAKGSWDFRVQTCPNDCILFSDTIQIVVDRGNVLQIPVQTTGVGSTVVFSQSDSEESLHSKQFSFGSVFCDQPLIRTFHITNRGRRAQTLRWSRVCDPTAKKAAKSKMKRNVFRFSPDTVILKPNTRTMCTMYGLSAAPLSLCETWTCDTKIEKSKMEPTSVFRAELTADFVRPTLQWTESDLTVESVVFRYQHRTGQPIPTMEKELTLSNTCALPLTVSVSDGCLDGSTLSITPISGVSLAPNESITVSVRWIPENHARTHQRQDWSEEKVLPITFSEHAYTQQLRIRAESTFQTLSFDLDKLSFPIVYPHIGSDLCLSLVNTGSAPCSFQWKFVGEFEQGSVDVKPHEGSIHPSQQRECHFHYIGYDSDHSIEATALCMVEDGPSYEFPITVRTDRGQVLIQADSNHDFGDIWVGKTVEHTMELQNQSEMRVFCDISTTSNLSLNRKQDTQMGLDLAPQQRRQVTATATPSTTGVWKAAVEVTAGVERGHTQVLRAQVWGSAIESGIQKWVRQSKLSHPPSMEGLTELIEAVREYAEGPSESESCDYGKKSEKEERKDGSHEARVG